MSVDLSHLPRPSAKRIAVHVKPAAERALRQGHPWLFEGGIRKQSRDGRPGDLAVVFDKKDRFLAIGLYDPTSQIRIKVLQANKPVSINNDWFMTGLESAFKLRQPLNTPHTNGYRLVHGENDGLPGLIVDRYADTFVLKLYTSAWIPHLHHVLPFLQARTERIVLRLSRNVQAETQSLYGLFDGQILYGEQGSSSIIFTENGLRFKADVIHGHKTGFFFDQRDNRMEVRQLAGDQTVLDVFAYSGGFSLYAAAGGAAHVTSVDVSDQALIAARHNFALNRDNQQVIQSTHETITGDAFEVLERLQRQRRRFGLVIIDPPAFAKRQDEIDGALHAYARLAELGSQLVERNGTLVMASCSSRVSADAFFQTVIHSTQRPLTIIQQTSHALDHPIGFPQGAYLKCLFASINN